MIIWYIKIYSLGIIWTKQETTSSLEQFILNYEDDKNAMIASVEQDEYDNYEEFYEELDNHLVYGNTMNCIFFGPTNQFLRLDAETLLHLLQMTDKSRIPITRTLLAWDIITDGKTPAFLQGREFMAMGSLLNEVPEEDLYYVNFGDSTVLKYFANNVHKLEQRKSGVLVSAYRRYYGDTWLKNATYINDLGYLICGFTTSDLQKISANTFTDISVALLNKMKHCTPAQGKVLYDIATREEAYNVPYSWTSHEIGRLGHLFTYIPEEDISSLQFQAVHGISKQVMMDMQQSKLTSFTKPQVLRMNFEARRIYILRTQLKYSLDTTQISKFCSGLMLSYQMKYIIFAVSVLLRNLLV